MQAPAESVSDTGQADGTIEIHRVGLAVVQLTRSTSAEATAGRESLQPSALRARCTRKGSRPFDRCQAPRSCNYRKYRLLRSRSAFVPAIRPASGNQRRNAPSQVLLRPAIRLTSAEASACRRAINLRRSVLGAIRTLRVDRGSVKRTATRFPAVCDLFFTRRTYLRLALCALSQKDQGFAEPGALSSTSPIDLPLPRTAPRESFVLLASRARRSGNLRSARDRRKGIRREKGRKLRSTAGFLQGKHVVVTGAGSGIGRAIARTTTAAIGSTTSSERTSTGRYSGSRVTARR